MDTIKRHFAFKVICTILVITFLSLDVSWAHPDSFTTQHKTLANESNFQAQMMQKLHLSKPDSMKLALATRNIGNYLLECTDDDSRAFAREHLHTAMANEFERYGLGEMAELIDLDGVNYLYDGKLVKIPCKNNQDIYIAKRNDLTLRELAAYDWEIKDDKNEYAVCVMARDHAEHPTAVAETEEEPEISVSEPVIEFEVEEVEAETPDAPKERIRISVRAIIVRTLLMMLVAGSAFADGVTEIHGPKYVAFGLLAIFAAIIIIKALPALMKYLHERRIKKLSKGLNIPEAHFRNPKFWRLAKNKHATRDNIAFASILLEEEGDFRIEMDDKEIIIKSIHENPDGTFDTKTIQPSERETTEQPIANLVRYRDNQYMKAVGATDTARLIAPSEDLLTPGHDAFEAVKRAGKAMIAVNLVSYNQIEGHLLAAQDRNAGIIIEIARSQLGYALDENKSIAYIKEVAERLNFKNPLIVHGDHIQYSEKLFKQKAILKEVYEKIHGKGTFNEDIDINTIDIAILQSVQARLKENVGKERQAITDINERLINAGFTSIAIDASTIFDEVASDIVLDYYLRYGTPQEKLIVQLENSFSLPLEWGTALLRLNPDKEEDKALFNQIKAKIISDMQKRRRPEDELNDRIKEITNAFGILRKEARKSVFNEEEVIDTYNRVMEEVAEASIAGQIPENINKTITEKQRLLLLPTCNAFETAFQLEKIKILLEQHKPELCGHFGIEIEVGHVDRKVPNPRRGGKLEAKMTHPIAVRLMGEYVASKGLSFDLIATNNGSGHGTEFDKDTLTPISQVGKISPFLTKELQEEAVRFGASIAQHGTSGSDMDELSDMAETGVIKFNIATNYQQIILNVLSLIDDGFTGKELLEKCESDKDALVSGIDGHTREKLKKMARAFKKGELTTSIEDSDSLFTKFIKLAYDWGISKDKIKADSDEKNIATVFAKEFKRVFCKMDQDLYKLGHSAPASIKRIGILTGGGPASGHNALIYAAYVEARRMGAELIGIFNGFDGLVNEELVNKARPLTFEEVDRVKDYGGTIIGADRVNPYSEKNIEKGIPEVVWRNIQKLELDALITAGGDDTNGAGGKLSKEHGNFPLIGVSKTIDNDLALPDNAPTYGYDTWVTYAREQARGIEENARALKRVIVAETFGRNADFDSLGVGMSIGAARTLIPEVEVDFEELVRDVELFYKRFGYAVVIVSEGIKIDLSLGKNREMLDKAFENDKIAEAYFRSAKKYDDFGHPKLEGAGRIVAALLDAHLPYKATETEKITYAARTTPPTFSDFERCILLGAGAVKQLFEGKYGNLLYIDRGTARTIPLEGQLGGRTVDVTGDYSTQYMHANVAILLRDKPDMFKRMPGVGPGKILPMLLFGLLFSSMAFGEGMNVVKDVTMLHAGLLGLAALVLIIAVMIRLRMVKWGIRKWHEHKKEIKLIRYKAYKALYVSGSKNKYSIFDTPKNIADKWIIEGSEAHKAFTNTFFGDRYENEYTLYKYWYTVEEIRWMPRAEAEEFVASQKKKDEKPAASRINPEIRPTSPKIDREPESPEIRKVEEYINNRRTRFVNSANEIINEASKREKLKDPMNNIPLERGSITADLIDRAEEIIRIVDQLDEEGLQENIASYVDFLKNNLDNIEGDSINASLIILARRAKTLGQKLVIPFSTDWIPGYKDERSLQKNAKLDKLIEGIESIPGKLAKMGLDNVEIVKREKNESLDAWLERIQKAMTNPDDFSYVVFLDSIDTIDAISSEKLQDLEQDKSPFYAGIDPSDFEAYFRDHDIDLISDQIYIQVMEMFSIALELATGKEAPELFEVRYCSIEVSYDRDKKMVIFLPYARQIDYNKLPEEYRAKLKALRSA